MAVTRILSTTFYILRRISSRPRLIVTLLAAFFGLSLVRKLLHFTDWLIAPLLLRFVFITIKYQWPWYIHNYQNSHRAFPQCSKDNTQLYTYTPLTIPQQIRLLEIAYIDHPKNFTFRLVPMSLDTLCSNYLAISYMWGDPSEYSQAIFTNGTFIGLTKSVSIILDSLYKANSSIFIWINSLYINQSNNKEKSGQIRLMNKIYSKAHQVVISLSKPTIDSNKVMDFLFKLQNTIQREFFAQKGGPELPGFDAILQASGILYTSTSWDSLSKFLCRP
jgi:hypothetical protein